MSARHAARPTTRGRRRGTLTRCRDVIVSALGLIATSPIVALALVLVRWSMGRPVLFRQERIGQGGRTFVLVKIRTMRNPDAADDGPSSDGRRLTTLGRALRATSIDELPTLWNVLRGDMSLVGPRPLPTRYVDRYSPYQARRHEIRPGITGWTQVGGRNALDWDEKFERDVWYVDNRTALLDLRILLRTVVRVIVPQGISNAGHATMPEFGLTESPRESDLER